MDPSAEKVWWSVARSLPRGPHSTQFETMFESGASQMKLSPVDSPQGQGPCPSPLSPTSVKPSYLVALPEAPVLQCPRIRAPACGDRQTDRHGQRAQVHQPPAAPFAPTLRSSQPQQYLIRVLQAGHSALGWLATVDRLRDDLLHALPEPGQHPGAGTMEGQMAAHPQPP